jgi:mRNA interferase RelE/StbE
MSWLIDMTRPARKDLSNLPTRERETVRDAIDRLALDPGRVDFRKLTGRANEWRLRVGRWRVIVEMDNAAGILRILRVLARGRAYRD